MVAVKQLRKGSYIVHKEEPCIVKEVVNVVTGTHSHTKVKISYKGIFSGVNDSMTLPPHDSIEEAEIIRKEGQLISKQDNIAQIMDMRTYETFNAEIEDGLELNENDGVTFIDFKGKLKVIDKR